MGTRLKLCRQCGQWVRLNDSRGPYCRDCHNVISGAKFRTDAAWLAPIRRRRRGSGISLAQWSEIKARYAYKCVACGSEAGLTRDHIRPLSKGGSDTEANIQPLCFACNNKKGDTYPWEPEFLLEACP